MVDLSNKPILRRAIIASIAERSEGKIGRTALMKLMYFLQALKGVQLGYNFRIYTYGPYDGQVLDDLRTAESLQVVTAQPFEWQGATGYTIAKGPQAAELIDRSQQDLAAIDGEIDWIVKSFAQRSASDLEVLSTIVFVDRASTKGSTAEGDLVDRVHEIKPHHRREKIETEIAALKEQKLLASLPN